MSEELQGVDPELEGSLREAAALSDENRWGEALELLQGLEEKHPENPTVLCMLGVTARELGAEGHAYEYFRRCLAQQPEDALVLVAAGVGVALFDDPEAEAALRLAALTAPRLYAARYHYGAYLTREGLYDLAIDELEAARSLEEDDPSAHLALGAACLLGGRTEEALSWMEQAIVLGPDDAGARLLYGLMLLEHDRMDDAAEQLHRAAADRPRDWEAQVVSALASADRGWEEEAWRALAQAEQSPERPDRAVLREVEEAIEAGTDEVRHLLRREIAPGLLRGRLLQRS